MPKATKPKRVGFDVAVTEPAEKASPGRPPIPSGRTYSVGRSIFPSFSSCLRRTTLTGRKAVLACQGITGYINSNEGEETAAELKAEGNALNHEGSWGAKKSLIFTRRADQYRQARNAARERALARARIPGAITEEHAAGIVVPLPPKAERPRLPIDPSSSTFGGKRRTRRKRRRRT